MEDRETADQVDEDKESRRCLTDQDETIYDNGEDDDLDSRIDENDDGTSLKIDCGNLCGPGEQICQQGEFSTCTAPKGTEELCDMEDNDCDGLVDEGISQTYYVDRDNDGFGSNDITSAVVSCMGNPSTSGANAVSYVVSNQDCFQQMILMRKSVSNGLGRDATYNS